LDKQNIALGYMITGQSQRIRRLSEEQKNPSNLIGEKWSTLRISCS